MSTLEGSLPQDTTTASVAARWTAEAERLHLRYQLEIVEALGLCPWAERSRLDATSRVRVLLQTDTRVDATLDAIDALIADPQAEVAFLIYPRLAIGSVEFARFVAGVQQADVPRHPLGGLPFMFAAFHPEVPLDASGADRLVPFLRRTPDPTIQLLRSSVLERVRNGRPQGTQFFDAKMLDAEPPKAPRRLADQVAHTNLATVDRIGVPELTRRYDAIMEDRKRTYRELEGSTLDVAPEPT